MANAPVTMPNAPKKGPNPDVERSSRPTPDLARPSKPNPDVENPSRPTPDLAPPSKPNPDVENRSRPTPDLAGPSKPNPDIKNRSRPTPDLAGRSRPNPDLEGPSRPTRNVAGPMRLPPLPLPGPLKAFGHPARPPRIPGGHITPGWPSGNKHGKRFSFKVPAWVLKRAFSVLADRTLNSQGYGLMEVCYDGFEISVYSDRHVGGEVFVLLTLNLSGLIDFVCNVPMVRRIKLGGIAKYLETNASDRDIVKVFAGDMSEELIFKFRKLVRGYPGLYQHNVDMFWNRETRHFPIFSYGFERSIPVDKLEPIVSQIVELPQGERPILVSVNIKTKVSIKLGNDFVVKLDENKLVWVMIPYWDSLKKALNLADRCTLCLATQPKDSVVLRFDIKGLGELIYLKHATEFFVKEDLPTIGTFWPLYPG